MGTVKDRNSPKRGRRDQRSDDKNTPEELYKKGIDDLDNHNGVITHLEPDILQCEVKWALGSITTNQGSGCDEIPVELFRRLKKKKKCC